MQVAALAGLPGIALLIYLPASLVHWALDYRPPRAQLIKGVSLVGLLLALAFGLGAARLGQASPKSPAVEVAVVSSPLHNRLSELLAPAYATGDPAAVTDMVARVRASLGPITVVHWNAYASGAGDLTTASPAVLEVR